MKCLLVCASLVMATVAQKNPHWLANRSSIVHLFEWKFDDIARECELFLGPRGFAGVQTSPVNEHVALPQHDRPWWERYQPMSYRIISRSGDEKAFASMVTRCHKAGIRVYVDVVFNHMTGEWSDPHGYGGSTAVTLKEQYPGVPYGPADFHADCSIKDYTDAEQMRNCKLSGLHDLNQTTNNVRRKIIGYLNKLIDYGVAGFRVDAAKHMWPEDLKYIYSKVKCLNTNFGFPSGARPFFYQEVIDLGGEAVKSSEYTCFGRVTEFKFSSELSKAFRGKNAIKYLKNFGPVWSLLPSNDALVFIDNHDNQRGHGAGGADILNHKDPKLYKMAVAFMLAWPYGCPRLMSSYYFNNTDAGPPADSTGGILRVAAGSNSTCANGWVCEHRWRPVASMVAFRNRVVGTKVENWWDNGDKQIAFSRGSKGFIALNDDEQHDLKQSLKTSLQAGTYCDVITGNKQNGTCTGKSVSVDSDGMVNVVILASAAEGALAIHVGEPGLTRNGTGGGYSKRHTSIRLE